MTHTLYDLAQLEQRYGETFTDAEIANYLSGDLTYRQAVLCLVFRSGRDQ